MSRRQVLGSHKPPSPLVLSGCGCLAYGGLLFSILNVLVAFSIQGRDAPSIIIDPTSILLGVGSLYALIIIGNMKRLHRALTPEEIWSNARDSTYRSLPMEHAFRILGIYLPLSVLIVFAYNSEYGNQEWGTTSLVFGSPAFFGVLLLPLQRRWKELRFKQVQEARDRLASSFFAELSRSASPERQAESTVELFDRPFFLYLRPFVSTDSIKSIALDSITSGPIDLEIRLADALAEWAPLIALGRPGEARGAGRNETSEGDWKKVIELAFQASDTIFMVPGYQEGIMWEMRLLVEKNLLERVVFIRPPEAERFNEEWWSKTRSAMREVELASPASLSQSRGAFFGLNAEGDIEVIVEFRKSAGFKQLRNALRKLRAVPEKVPGVSEEEP